MFWPFKKKQQPAIGEVWVNLCEDGSPWPAKVLLRAVILDVQGGWVRYDLGSPFRDNRMKLGMFTRLYKKGE